MSNNIWQNVVKSSALAGLNDAAVVNFVNNLDLKSHLPSVGSINIPLPL